MAQIIAQATARPAVDHAPIAVTLRPRPTEITESYTPRIFETTSVLDSETGSTTLAFRPRPTRSSSLETSISSTSAVTPFPFLSLPDEVQMRVLSYVPAEEVAVVCRTVCRDLRDFIDYNEDRIAQPKMKHKCSELRHRIDFIEHIEPYDFASFIAGFQFWIQQRGLMFTKEGAMLAPFLQWIHLLYQGRGKGGGSVKRPRIRANGNRTVKGWKSHANWWHNQTAKLVCLQKALEVDHGNSEGLEPWDYPGIVQFFKDACRLKFCKFTNFIKNTNSIKKDILADVEQAGAEREEKRLTPTQQQRSRFRSEEHRLYKESCDKIYEKSGSQPFFTGQAHSGHEEEYATYSDFRLTESSLEEGGHQRTLDTVCRPENVGQLALPTLPDAMFCYYVEQQWCCDALNSPIPLSPLKRAAVIERTKTF